VDPAFWPLDIVAMLLGCLLGAFLPAFADEAETIGGSKAGTIFWRAWIMIGVVFLAIIFAGIPEEDYNADWSFFTSVGLLGFATLALAYLMIYVPMQSRIGHWRSWHYNNLFYRI
jgi:Na+/H+-dicarboxylate symporter